MNRTDALSLAIKTKLVLPDANCVDGAYAYSDGDLQDALYEFARAIEKAALERAAFECSFLAGMHRQGAQHSDINEDFDSYTGAQKGCTECSEALLRLSQEPTE